ncbi:hypothetical protein BGZ65_009007, partial [Modicella reniformis]
MARFLILAHATRTLRITPEGMSFPWAASGLLRSSGCLSFTLAAHSQEIFAARCNIAKTFAQQQQSYSSLFSTSACHLYPSSSSLTSAEFWHLPSRSSFHRAAFLTRSSFIKEFPPHSRAAFQQQCRAYSRYPVKKRGSLRFLFKTTAIATAFVAIPTFLIFGLPGASFIFVPIVVGGMVGGTILFTGGLFLIVFPIVVLGGALTLWLYAVPAIVVDRELNKILKRAQNQDFNEKSTGRVNIQMAMFDSTDHSTTYQWSDSTGNDVTDHGNNTEVVVDNENGGIVKRSERSSTGRFEISNSSNSFSTGNLKVVRENGHVRIEIEDDGD